MARMTFRLTTGFHPTVRLLEQHLPEPAEERVGSRHGGRNRVIQTAPATVA
jgi:hypothetical protein